MPTFSANLGSQTFVDIQVVDATHPAIIQTRAVKADNGKLVAGLLLADASNGLVAYNPALTQAIGTGDGTETDFAATLTTLPVHPGSLTVTSGAQTLSDDGCGRLYGDGTGTINYTSGAVAVTFTAAPANAAAVTATHANRLAGVSTLAVDTSKEGVALVLVHGTVVRDSLTVAGGTAVTQTDTQRLAALTVHAL